MERLLFPPAAAVLEVIIWTPVLKLQKAVPIPDRRFLGGQNLMVPRQFLPLSEMKKFYRYHHTLSTHVVLQLISHLS